MIFYFYHAFTTLLVILLPQSSIGYRQCIVSSKFFKIIMGLTESNSRQEDIENNHKLIRRFNSEAYGDLTVVKNKADQSLWALKQLIVENGLFEKLIQQRSEMTHRSLVGLKQYWHEAEQSLCSNLRKTLFLFEYFPRTLEEEIQVRREQQNCFFGDWEILRILGDGLDCLKYLESMNHLHLITSIKSILYDPASETIKLIENLEMFVYSYRNNKINIMGLASHKKIYPLHSANEPRENCDSCMDQAKVAHQNIFVLCLICLSLCFLMDPIELGLITKAGNYDFKKIQKRVNQIEKKFPKTHSVLKSLLLALPSQIKYIDALKEISYERRSFYKQNRNSKSIEMRPNQKVERRRKKPAPPLACSNQA